MNKKILNIVGVILLSALVSFGIVSVGKKTVKYVGGNFNSVMVDFGQGLSVNGTTIITNAGVLTPVSISTTGAITTSGLLTSTGGITVTGASTIGSASNGLKMFRPKVLSTGDTTLTVATSGTTYLTATAGVDWTLPAVALSNGAFYRFRISGAFATTSVTIVSAEGDNIEGSLIVAGAVVDCSANDVITFVNDGEDIGDYVDLSSDGTNWYIDSSNGLTASKLTCSG